MLHKLYFYDTDQDAIFSVLDEVLRLQECVSPGLKRVYDTVHSMDATLLQRIAEFRKTLTGDERRMANHVMVTDEEIDILGSAIAILDWGFAKNSTMNRHINVIRMIVAAHTGKNNI